MTSPDRDGGPPWLLTAIDSPRSETWCVSSSVLELQRYRNLLPKANLKPKGLSDYRKSKPDFRLLTVAQSCQVAESSL